MSRTYIDGKVTLVADIFDDLMEAALALDAARARPDEAGLRAKIEALPEMVGEPNDGGWSLVRRSDVLAALSQPAVPVAGAEEGLTGRAVHAAWRDGMLAQGRDVAPERMSWDTLSIEDRLLDDGIAAALCPDEFGVNRLAKALVDSGLMQRYSDYANSLPTMRHGTPEELARDWAPTILAALRVARARPDEAGLREAVKAYVDWQYREKGASRFTLTALRAALAQPAVPVAGAEGAALRAKQRIERFLDGWTALGSTTAPDVITSIHVRKEDGPRELLVADLRLALRAAQPEDDGLGMREAYRRGWLEATSRSSEPPAQPGDDGLARSGVDDVGELREALEAAIVWLDAEVAHPRGDPRPAMSRLSDDLRAALATTQPERRDGA